MSLPGNNYLTRRSLAREVVCPRCHAPEGVACHSAAGSPIQVAHSERYRCAKQAVAPATITDETPVNALPLSVRSANCLANSDIRTVGDFRRYDKDKLMRFPNFGKTSLAEVVGLIGGDIVQEPTRPLKPFTVICLDYEDAKRWMVLTVHVYAASVEEACTVAAGTHGEALRFVAVFKGHMEDQLPDEEAAYAEI